MRKLLAALLVLFTLSAHGDAPVGKPQPPAAVASVELAKPTPIAELFQAAIEFGGYKDFCAARRDGCPAPMVRLVPLPENIQGTFNFLEPTVINIAIDAEDHSPGTVEWNETVVHEFTHYLQWLSGKYSPAIKDECKMMYEIELEAYTAGYRYKEALGLAVDYERMQSSRRIEYAFCVMASFAF